MAGDKTKKLQAMIGRVHRDVLNVLADPKLPPRHRTKLGKLATDLLRISQGHATVAGRGGTDQEAKVVRWRLAEWFCQWIAYLYLLRSRGDYGP